MVPSAVKGELAFVIAFHLYIFIYYSGDRLVYLHDILNPAGGNDVGFSFLHADYVIIRICLPDCQYAAGYPVVYFYQSFALFYGGDQEHIFEGDRD